jgi:hypothetical protein
VDNATDYQKFTRICSKVSSRHHPQCSEGKTGNVSTNDACDCAEYFWYVAGVGSVQETKQEEKPLLIYIFPDPYGNTRTEV